MLLKRLYIFLLLVCMLNNFSACNRASAGSNLPGDGSLTSFRIHIPEVDTMAIIARSIRAAYKNKQLDSLYQFKALKNGFNGNVLIAQKGVIVYQNSFGYSNYERKDSLTTETRFQLASLSKTFTAVAVLKLMEDGFIHLNDKITDYFPSLPFRNVTIEMLLDHRSGIANYVNIYGDQVENQNLYPDNNDILRWLEKCPRKFIDLPGRNFSYSNTNYLLLASLIEKVTCTSFSEYLHKNILEPLGMSNTYLLTDSTEEAIGNRASCYTALWKPVKMNHLDRVVGDKGVYSTITDLYKWYEGLTHYKILKKETLDEAWKPRSFESRGQRNYGYGFRMTVSDSEKVVYHNGWWNSCNTLFYMNPKRDYVIIVLGNKYNNDVYNIHNTVEIMNESLNDDNEKMFE